MSRLGVINEDEIALMDKMQIASIVNEMFTEEIKEGAELIEIRYLLTVKPGSGIQKKAIGGFAGSDGTRRSQRLLGRPDIFLIRTHRERSI